MCVYVCDTEPVRFKEREREGGSENVNVKGEHSHRSCQCVNKVSVAPFFLSHVRERGCLTRFQPFIGEEQGLKTKS